MVIEMTQGEIEEIIRKNGDWISIEEIKKRVDLTKASLYRNLRSLQEWEIIETQSIGLNGKGYVMKRYRIKNRYG